MKKTLLALILFSSLLLSENIYTKQVKVVDKCAYLVEPLTIESLGIKGANANDFEAQKAIRACEISFAAHPNDPHVQFLLARAYTKGTADTAGMGIPKSVKLLIPELNDVSPHYEKGYHLAKRSCSGGDLGGCELLGYYARKGLYQKKRSSKKAYLLWLWSCEQGNAKACQHLSAIVKNGSYVPKDLKPDYLYSLESCKSGYYPRACEVFEDQMVLKKYPIDDDTKLYVFYKACVSGSNNACYKLEKFLDQNKSSENREKLHYAIKVSCNNGNAKACEKLGELYAQLPDTKINNMIASTFFENGCESGAERFSCWYAGHYRVYPRKGVTQDIDLGISQWEKACYIGKNAFACYDLAHFYIHTENKKYNDKKRAIKPLTQGCQYGNGYAYALGCQQGIESCCRHP